MMKFVMYVCADRQTPHTECVYLKCWSRFVSHKKQHEQHKNQIIETIFTPSLFEIYKEIRRNESYYFLTRNVLLFLIFVCVRDTEILIFPEKSNPIQYNSVSHSPVIITLPFSPVEN